MGRRALAFLFLLGLALAGCSPLQSITTDPPSGPIIEVAIADDNRTVLFDASDYLNYQASGLRFYWDFEGTGTFVEDEPIVVHVYPNAGIYFCRLKVEGWTGGSTGGGGSPGGINGGGTSGSDVYKIRAIKVDLLQKNYPVPIIKIWDAWTNQVDPERISALHWLVFDASASYSPEGDELWFRWEFVYVEQENGEWVPKPYPWPGCITCPTEPEFMRFQGPQVEFRYGLPAPSCCGSGPFEPWVYRVRLWITDSHGRTSFKEVFVKVYPC